MVRSAVKVVLRTRPSADFASSNIDIGDDEQTLQLFLSRQSQASKNLRDHYEFKFDHILHDRSQEDTFSVCALDILQGAVEGYNGTILAYGQTGAGKTYTMTGKGSAFPQRGITPRAITEVFQRLREEGRSSVSVWVSYVEIYNENFYDLLCPNTDPSSISVVEDSKGNVRLKGVEARPVSDEADALGALFEGETARAIAEHQMNKRSSRSHAIFTIFMESRTHHESEEIVASKLHLVDLAGSERVSKTGSTGKVLKEAAHINKSLAFLEQTITALSERNRDHVPYRSSKLTHLLKGSLGGNCKTLMIANIWGELAQLDETLSTCRFAQRMARVSNEAVLNTRQNSVQVIKKYEREIQDLKAELAMHDQFTSRGEVVYSAYTDTQRQMLEAQVLAYFASSEPEHSFAPLDLSSLRHVKEILIQCKTLYNSRHQPGAAPGGSSASLLTPLPASEDGYVGELEEDPLTMGIPAAPEDPPLGAELFPPQQSGQAPRAEQVSSPQSEAPTAPSRPPPASSEAALEEFKAGEGKLLSEALVDNRKGLRAAKQKQKETALRINATKREIDALKEQVEAISGGDPADGQVVDDATYQAMLSLKDLKAKYRDDYKELQMIKSEVEYTTKLVESCSTELSATFKQWFAREFGVPQEGSTATSTSQAPASIPPSVGPPPSVASSAHRHPAGPASQLSSPPSRRQPTSTAKASPPSAASPEETAFQSAMMRGSASPGTVRQAARTKVPGTFGSGPKISASKTNMDVDQGRR